MNREEKLELLSLLEEKKRRESGKRLFTYYPDEGLLRRKLYVKHTTFFEAGAKFNERLMMAANRVGKTEGVGAYEVTLHLTGLYPPWWNGKRFNKPTHGWAAGDSLETVRDIIQEKLLGKLDDISYGSGMIPRDHIVDYSRRVGKADTVDTIQVRHVSGGISTLGLKSYDQKRKSFQGTKKDFIWLDEEPPLDIYTEALMRTADTSGRDEDNGLMILTFTPLSGLSETVMSFLKNGEIKEVMEGTKFVIFATWDDAPHLSARTKEKLWNSIPPFQRDARSKGIPQLGAGAIYPIPESTLVIPDIPIPDHWPRAYGMDVGWNRTAAIFGAFDRESQTLYIYNEHYMGEEKPVVHAEAIKARGDWIPGVIDPASRGRSQVDGEQLYQMYYDLGLKLNKANNGVESGLLECWTRMAEGRIKVFASCQNWIAEYRLYRRDEKGKVVKGFDHAMDSFRYLINSGLDIARTKPAPKKKNANQGGGHSAGWMG